MGVQETVWHRDQAAVRFACLCGNYGFEFRNVINRCGDRLHCEGYGGGFEGLQVYFGIWRRFRMEQESDSVDARRDLLEQLKPFTGYRRLEINETGEVAARLR